MGLRVKLCANEVRRNLRERLVINSTTQSLQVSDGVEIFIYLQHKSALSAHIMFINYAQNILLTQTR